MRRVLSIFRYRFPTRNGHAVTAVVQHQNHVCTHKLNEFDINESITSQAFLPSTIHQPFRVAHAHKKINETVFFFCRAIWIH